MLDEPGSVSAALLDHLREVIAREGGWIGFERYMHEVLYAPGLGYYARGRLPFGTRPEDGSDFVTAPEMSPLFGRALAVQVAQGLRESGGTEVVEFGAGSGALAAQLLESLDAAGVPVQRYVIVEVSGGLRARQRERLAALGDRVQWAERWPEAIEGVVVGNEVLDAMPARLLAFDGVRWAERGVAWHAQGGDLVFADAQPDDSPGLHPPVDGPFVPGTVVEVQPQAQAFIASLAGRLRRGLALFIDYGFPQPELYHPQRTGGTLMCHRGHRADGNPLADPGLKDVTVHVDFTVMALAAQDAGLEVAGYTSQGRFLINCGLVPMMEASPLPVRAAAHRLIAEHEMGELFKVLALTRGVEAPLVGFAEGDRTHRL